MTILANCKIISSNGKRPLFSAKGAASLTAWGIALGGQSHIKQALKVRFSFHLRPDLAVNRAFSAGRFRIPKILGHRPRLSNERCALGALENFRAVMPQLYEFTQTQK